jgi:hypothetical protein
MKQKYVLTLVAFITGAYLSNRFAASSWYVGPIFGTVVLVWHSKANLPGMIDDGL